MTLFLNGTWKVTHRPYQADIQDILAEISSRRAG